MKKTIALFLMLFFLILNSIYAGDQEDKKVRDTFYSMIQEKLGFSRTDCSEMRKAGYSPQFSLAFLYIARETGRPISELLTLREKQGYSLKDLCDEFKVDYESIAAKYRTDVIKYKIQFPMGTKAENKKTITTIPRKKSGN